MFNTIFIANWKYSNRQFNFKGNLIIHADSRYSLISMTTEDETFRRLKKAEFGQLNQHVNAATAGIEDVDLRRSVYLDTLKASGWTQEEYIIAVADTLDRIFTPKKTT